MPAQNTEGDAARPHADMEELALALRRAGVGTGRVVVDLRGEGFTLRAVALNASQARSTRRILAKLAGVYGNLVLAPGWTRSELLPPADANAVLPEPELVMVDPQILARLLAIEAAAQAVVAAAWTDRHSRRVTIGALNAALQVNATASAPAGPKPAARSRFRPMRSAPHDREILLKLRNSGDGSVFATQGCWMAPGGEVTSEGWWCAAAVTGTDSFSGLPHRHATIRVAPLGWMELPIPRLPR